MSGIAYLVEAFAEGNLLRPRPEVRNLVDMSRAVAHVCGVGGLELTENSRAIADTIGEADHVVLVLIDGLGMNLLESLPPDSFLRRHVWEQMQTVFPSTTAVALTSLTTGEWPQDHAVTGWWTQLPALGSAATILSYTARSNNQDLLKRGIPPEVSFPVESLWKSMPRDVQVIVPKAISDSVYSRYFSGGRQTIGYESLSNGVDAVARHISESEGKTFTYLYSSRVDSEAHMYGMTRPQVQHALAEVEREIERLARLLGDKARIVATADHGFLDAAPPKRHTLRVNRQLQPMFRLMPSGDARVMYLYTLEWAKERVRRYFEQRFEQVFMVVDMEDAIKIQLFGPTEPTEETRERLGDLVVVSSGEDVLEYNASRGSGRMLKLNGHHSGLTPDEMLIPLIIV
ncbi:MAG: alkaline phosphatase family protein [Dehalococcoidia bacterium]|nr:alkaline phosphatase family protein [Dehalococcoidia bacterium]